MIQEEIVVSENTHSLKEFLSTRKNSLFIGALSFEERCIGALRSLRENGLSINNAMILTYPTKAYPPSLDSDLRAKHLVSIKGFQQSVIRDACRTHEISSHSFHEILVRLALPDQP